LERTNVSRGPGDLATESWEYSIFWGQLPRKATAPPEKPPIPIKKTQKAAYSLIKWIGNIAVGAMDDVNAFEVRFQKAYFGEKIW
jgi:hypothetical protein